MSESKHTPGPWNRVPASSGLGLVIAVGKWPVIATCQLAGSGSETVANANLIAAAPDLLAACELALRFWVAEFPNDTGEAMAALESVRAAVAKARGETR